MFDWITKLFIDEKIKKEEKEDTFAEMDRKEEEKNLNKEKINLECKGSYYYKTKDQEEHGSFGWRMSHAVYMVYNINVTLEGELESVFVSGNMFMDSTRTERESYEFIIKSMENGAEPFMEKLKKSIIRDYKTHLANNDMRKLKDMVKNKKPINVSFTIETTK